MYVELYIYIRYRYIDIDIDIYICISISYHNIYICVLFLELVSGLYECSPVLEGGRKKRIQGPPPVSPSYDSWAYLPSWFMDVYGTQISCYIMFNIYHKP